ncbi:hypothetical protein TNCV_4976511 [Trichonephila clavipes]|nr:hypothetical protein TNCV_4976511 [Trichonephila clavipes]
MWKRPYLAGYTWRGATTEEHVLRQEVRAGHITRSNMPYHSKDRAEGTVKIQQTKKLPHVAKVDLVWQLGV